MTLLSRARAARLLLAFAFFTLPLAAQAQTYPARTITIVVSFAAGGFVDTVARVVGQKLSQRLGQTVVIENKPGAAGNIAHRFVAGAAPDGYTLLATSTAIAVNETLYRNRGYKADDFSTVAIVATTPEVLVNNAAGPTTLKEIVERSRTTPTNFGTAGAGSASYIVAEYFFKELGKGQATHIPFQGGAPLLNAALSNHIELKARRHRPERTDLCRTRLSRFHRAVVGRLLRAGQNAAGDRDRAERCDRRHHERPRYDVTIGAGGVRPALWQRSAG
jgi:tripartite-type tricarboxylate transporter receptor subunit TctC